MGANLARNIANHNFPTVVYNRTTEKMTKFIKEHGTKQLFGEKKLEAFVKKIESPRKIILMVQAGSPVDKVIESLLPLIDEGDIIIDCGNSNFQDTQRRTNELEPQGIHFVGCGVSGGEEGALNGPSMMPGGSLESWESLKPIFEAISADDFDGGPCVTHIGQGGAGHYVKMVHNGIEYAVMQIMADAYEALRTLYRLEPNKISDIFSNYHNGRLNSYLFEIAVEVLRKKDDLTSDYLIDHILDRAGNKGTGKWTAIDALERGVGLPAITSAVFARYNSSHKDLRTQISQYYRTPEQTKDIELDKFIPILENALYAGMLCAYAEGYHLIQTAAKEESWDINLSEVARIWEGGCIIRAKILSLIHQAYAKCSPDTHLLEIPEIISELKDAIPALRQTVSYLSHKGLALHSLPATLSYFESMTNSQSSANFIQGLRDYFGAHTYERNDKQGTFHTDWN